MFVGSSGVDGDAGWCDLRLGTGVNALTKGRWPVWQQAMGGLAALPFVIFIIACCTQSEAVVRCDGKGCRRSRRMEGSVEGQRGEGLMA